MSRQIYHVRFDLTWVIGVMSHSHCTGPGPGNDGFLYYSLHRDTDRGQLLSIVPIQVPIPVQFVSAIEL